MNLSTDTIDLLTRRIQQKYPEFKVQAARLLASGQYNDAIVVNDNWVFRFPRHELGTKNLNTEFTVLQYLQGSLPLQIPSPTYVKIDLEKPVESFMGYPMITGMPLTRESAIEMNSDALMSLATKVNDFVQTLHGLHIPEEVEGVLKRVNTFAEWEELYERIQYHLFPHMRLDARMEVCHHFESFLNSPSVHTFRPTLIHGDIGAGNILLNGNHQAVAVIDFGSVEIGDPASDYAAISTIHPDMLDLLVQRNPQVRQYKNRIQFYRGTFALQEALYGAEAGDAKAFRAGMENYI